MLGEGLKQFTKTVLETALNEEMFPEDFVQGRLLLLLRLRQEPSSAGPGIHKYSQRHRPKTVMTEAGGHVPIEVPPRSASVSTDTVACSVCGPAPAVRRQIVDPCWRIFEIGAPETYSSWSVTDSKVDAAIVVTGSTGSAGNHLFGLRGRCLSVPTCLGVQRKFREFCLARPI